MSKQIIVGAGLSGMTAGICLAREGYEVEIWDRGKAIGGVNLDQETKIKRSFATADMTPFDVDRLSRYLGFDLTPDKDKSNGMNYFTPLPSARFYISGRESEMHYPDDLQMKLVERGPRPSSLDSHLYRTATAAGVKFRYDAPVESKRDFAELPPGTIIATGMFQKAFEALDVPSVPAYACYAVQEFKNYKGPETIVYLDKYTKDYGYFTIINGIGAGILFQRGERISTEAQEWFSTRLKADAGLEFSQWHTIENYLSTPTGSLFNPRLFHKNLILTGTLAGVQDPSWVIGVHGAMVSGKIAAIAVKDKQRAAEEFRVMNQWWWVGYLGKKFFDITRFFSRDWIMRPIISSEAEFHQKYLWYLYPAIPGLRRV